jgi:vacuolar-type H+-ATPase subunit H
VVREIIDKIRDAEIRAEKLIEDARIDADRTLARFYESREQRLREAHRRNEEIEKQLIAEAEGEAGKQESAILTDAQKEMNVLRASADRKKQEAVSFIIKRIAES